MLLLAGAGRRLGLIDTLAAVTLGLRRGRLLANPMRLVQQVVPSPQSLAKAEFSTLRRRSLKVAVRIKETASRIRLAFAANCPDAALFRRLIGSLILRDE